MSWLDDYRLVLLDFDGMLVDTEQLHYRAYQNMCRDRGYELVITFREYCEIAHKSSEGLENMVYSKFPQLKKEEPNWDVLYAEKKQAIIDLLNANEAKLMPGAEAFLNLLAESGVQRCVVTNSANELISVLRKQYPILDSIPHWITREFYTHPKPHPECYHYAIEKLSEPGDSVIGFEDTIRGVKALQGTEAQAVLVCPRDHPCLDKPVDSSVIHIESLLEVDRNSFSLNTPSR